MTREEKSNLLNELLVYEENNDIGNLTRAERREFQQWIIKALEQEPRKAEDNAISEYTQLKEKLIELYGYAKGYREALEQEPCEDEYIKVPKKALKYRTAEMVAYNVEWLKKHFDMERAIIFGELAESEVNEMSEQMKFPESFEKFAKEYGFKDDKEIYTNGSDLIPIFRVKQWLEHDNKLRTILDTIIAEIEALNPVDYVSMSSYEGHRGAEDMKDDVLQIIDKYMTESEIKG